MPWRIYLACSSGETFDWSLFVALHTTITIDGLDDILEGNEVQQSWVHAAMLNAKEQG